MAVRQTATNKLKSDQRRRNIYSTGNGCGCAFRVNPMNLHQITRLKSKRVRGLIWACMTDSKHRSPVAEFPRSAVDSHTNVPAPNTAATRVEAENQAAQCSFTSAPSTNGNSPLCILLVAAVL